MTYKYKYIDDKKIELTDQEIAELNANDKEFKNGAFDRAIKDLRQERNILLQETDWWALSDLTMTDEQKKYRQDLRDLTNGLSTVKEVNAVEFPKKPS